MRRSYFWRLILAFLGATLTTAMALVQPPDSVAVIHQYHAVQQQSAQEVAIGQRQKLTSAQAQTIALRAFLRGGITAAETEIAGKEFNPYQITFRYRTFTSYADHPRICVPFEDGSNCSTAAGAYQFLEDTWDGLREEFPDMWDTSVPAFAPQNQDIGAILLLVRRGSYRPLMNGVSVLNQRVVMDRSRFNEAIYKSCKEWASFPCAPGRGFGDSNGFYDRPKYDNQNARSIDWLWSRFQRELAVEQRVLGDAPTIVATPTPTRPAVTGYQLPAAYRRTMKEGDLVAGWVVTSDYGWRNINVAGASSFHRGVDAASPDPSSPTKGKTLYAIGLPDTMVSVRCWWDRNGGGLVATLVPESLQVPGQPRLSFDYLHTMPGRCIAPNGQTVRVKAGSAIAAVGDTGVGVAHFHLGQRVGRTLIDPQLGYMVWALTGKPPQGTSS